ncbi:MAG: hypothetical protein K2X46_03550 [Roseomonas sp.]|nr:hypothetical protein [Roseomonas sp.]
MKGLALLLLLALAVPARAQESRFAGDWSGTYVCTQGSTGMNLRLRPQGGSQGDGRLSGVFHFFPLASNPQAAEGCYEIAATPHGTPDGDTATITAGRWLLHPPNYVTVDLDAELDEDGTLFGQVIGPGCTLFAARRAPPRNLPAACGAVVSTR